MQQSQEAAAEAETQRHRAFGLEVKSRVVQTQLFEGVAQKAVLRRLHRIEAGEDHGLDLLKARQRLTGWVGRVGDRVTDLGVGDRLDVGVDEARLAGRELLAGHRLG